MNKQRGKGQIPAGQDSPIAKLTERDVLDIRDRHSKGEKQVTLAKEFQVRPQTIQCIISHKTWKHL